MTIEFGELPNKAGRGQPDWKPVADQLTRRPGAWAKIDTKDNVGAAGSLAGRIKRGRMKAFRPLGHFEAVVRGSDVWARYVGPASS